MRMVPILQERDEESVKLGQSIIQPSRAPKRAKSTRESSQNDPAHALIKSPPMRGVVVIGGIEKDAESGEFRNPWFHPFVMIIKSQSSIRYTRRSDMQKVRTDSSFIFVANPITKSFMLTLLQILSGFIPQIPSSFLSAFSAQLRSK